MARKRGRGMDSGLIVVGLALLDHECAGGNTNTPSL